MHSPTMSAIPDNVLLNSKERKKYRQQTIRLLIFVIMTIPHAYTLEMAFGYSAPDKPVGDCVSYANKLVRGEPTYMARIE